MEIIRELPPLQEATMKAATLAEEITQLRAENFALKKRLEQARRDVTRAEMDRNRHAGDARKSRALWQKEHWRAEKLEKTRGALRATTVALTIMTAACAALFLIIAIGGVRELVRWF